MTRLTALVLCAVLWGGVSAQTPLPLPNVTGPLPMDADSHAFGAAAHAAEPLSLATFDYVEEEYLLSGVAQVYDWPDPGDAIPRVGAAPYTTRVLIRRPRDPERFSGTVVVEPLQSPQQYDLNTGWALNATRLLDHGDAWVGITSRPAAVVSLITFDPIRYGALDWSNPLPVTDPANCNVAGSDSQYTENGLVWDVLRHTASWLRSAAASNPLRYGDPASRAQRLIGWGYGEAGRLWHTYIDALHSSDRESLGAPLFDGYLIGAAYTAAPIHQCAEPILPDDPRARLRNPGVPVFRVLTQTEVLPYATLGPRQLDDRATDAYYRAYDIAGAARANDAELRASAPDADIRQAGREPPPASCAEGPRGRFPNQIVFAALLAHLDAWIADERAPPRGEPIAVADGAYVTDADGNVVGGIRSPHVDVPISTWHGSSTGAAACAYMGHEVLFSKDRLERTFPSSRAYARAVQEGLQPMLQSGFILQADVEAVLTEARLRPVP